MNDSLAYKVENKKFQERGRSQSENNKNKRTQFIVITAKLVGILRINVGGGTNPMLIPQLINKLL